MEHTTRQSWLTSLWVYVAMTYTFIWLFTLPTTLSGRTVGMSSLPMVLIALGGLEPAIISVVLTHCTQAREERCETWRRIIAFRRISPPWFTIIFLTVPVSTMLAGLTDRLLGGKGLQW